MVRFPSPLVAVLAAMLLGAAPWSVAAAGVESFAENVRLCEGRGENPDPAGRIAACDWMLEKGDLAPAEQAVALINRGLVHSEQGAFEAALADFGRALALNPDSAAAHERRANIHFRLARYGSAAEDFVAATRIEPTVRRHNASAVGLLLVGRADEALTHIEAAKGMMEGAPPRAFANNACWLVTLTGAGAAAGPACAQVAAGLEAVEDELRGRYLDTLAFNAWVAGRAEEASARLAEAVRLVPGLGSEERRRAEFLALRVQRELQVAGRWPRAIDGKASDELGAAIAAFQGDRGLTVDGAPSRTLLDALVAANARR